MIVLQSAHAEQQQGKRYCRRIYIRQDPGLNATKTPKHQKTPQCVPLRTTVPSFGAISCFGVLVAAKTAAINSDSTIALTPATATITHWQKQYVPAQP